MSKYLGKKGYTIKKNSLSQTELYELRNNLDVKPNNQLNGYISNISYPIYEIYFKIYIQDIMDWSIMAKLKKIFYIKDMI